MPCIMNSVIHTDVPDAKKALLDICSPVTRAVSVDLLNADNRVVFRDIIAPRDLPHYTSCRGDGYAVVASDTASAGNGLGDPLLIQVKTAEVAAGTCMAVNTGDVLPPGADAVVRLEDTRIECNGIRILAAVKAGDNLGAKGSMVKQGTVIYPGGTLLKPTDIGTLCMFGFTSVRVYNKPRVLIVPTGDEVVEPGRKPGAGMVNEANGIMCSQLVRRWGGNPTLHEIVRDNPAAIADALHEGQDYDLIITTGGTSVGGRDRITGVLSSIGKVLVHFVGVVPGRPMGIGYMDVPGRKIPVLCLPGPVAACATVMFLFAAPAIRKLAHLPEPPLPRSMTTLAQDVTGFEGFVRLMKIEIDNGHARIVNIAGDSMGSGTIAYLVKDGDCDGFRKDEPVEAVFLE